MKFSSEFYRNKKVLITGHTGFKGSWMSRLLLSCGAEVTGYGLAPEGETPLFDILSLAKDMHSVIGEIRDLEHLEQVFAEVQPEIVIHMAAQPIVRESYARPVYTYETNVMGTVHVLEAIRKTPSVRSFVNVTTDKVYLNREWHWGYRETDELNGYDPYSNSKSCSELVTSSYRNSFFDRKKTAVSTCRAGNVIGGGDYAKDRIIPDSIRETLQGKKIAVRNPFSVRPYQHVLEPVTAYLLIAQAQYENPDLQDSYNIGPQESSFLTTGELVSLFCEIWNEKIEGTGLSKAAWTAQGDNGPHEASLLKLDCAKIRSVIGWKPGWQIREAVERIAEWEIARVCGKDMKSLTDAQIFAYLETLQ